MTVSSSTNRVSYSGNGTLTTFAYTFKVFDQDDLTVILRASNGAETVQTITTDYTVTGVGDVGGGNVVFTTAPTATETVVILREQGLTQGLDLVPNDPFPAQSLEESLDKLTFMVQQHNEELGRAIKASRTNTIAGSEFTISAADRANKVFSFDASGDLAVTQELGVWQGDWATSTAFSVRDIVKDASNNNVYICITAHTSSGSTPISTNTDSAKWALLIDAASAASSASAAAASETAAETAQTAAEAAQTAAETAQTAAETAETNAETAQTAAETAKTDAETAQTAAETALDSFDDRYLGAKSSDPTVDNDGDALIDGALYFDTTNNVMKVYDLGGTAWNRTTPTSAEQTNIDTVSGISANVTTVAGISSNVTTVADISSDVTTVAADGTDIGTVAGISANVTTVAGVSSDVTTVAGISSDVTTVAADGTDIGTVAGISSDVTTVSGISSNVTTVAGISANVTTVAGISANVTTVAGDTANINTIATDLGGDDHIGTVAGSISNVNSVGGSIANVNTVATNLTSVNSFANTYRIGTTDPTTSLDTGDLFFNTSSGVLKVYNGSAWEAGVTAGSGFMPLTGGGFSGDVSFGDNDKAIFGAGSDLQIYHDGSNSFIDEAGTGNLRIRASSALNLQTRNTADTAWVNSIIADDGAGVRLFTNGSKKLETTSTGVDVTGTVAADQIDIGNGTQTSFNVEYANDGLGVGPILRTFRDSASPAVSDSLGALDFKGNNSAGTETFYARIKGVIIDPADTTEDGAVEISIAKAGTAAWETSGLVAKFDPNGMELRGDLRFEGSTANNAETTLTVTDPTADRTITLPDASGTVVLEDNGTVALRNASSAIITIHEDANDVLSSPKLRFQRGVNDTWGADSYTDWEFSTLGSDMLFYTGSNGTSVSPFRMNADGVFKADAYQSTAATITYASTIQLSASNGGIQTVTLTGNVEFTRGLDEGEAIVLMLNNGASHTVTWTTVDKWVSTSGNAAPTLTDNETIVLWKVGTLIYAARAGSYT